ncbi:MAG: TRAP transporter small permease [Mogibacterium sp.]|nr:TRAP transporter small permease [Mogibacterium sp.]
MIREKVDVVVGALNKVCNLLLGIVMVVMFIVLMLQIISRFVAFMPIPWSQDLITFLLVCSVFLGAGAATAKGKQIRLEFFVDLFPEKVTKIILCVADLVSIIFLVVITQQAIQMGQENIHTVMGGSLVAFGYYYMVVAFGCIVMICNFVMLILDRIAEITGKAGKEEIA